MFDIGWSELLVVGVVALVVVGPKELPGLLRSLGKALATVRRMAGDFQSQFNEAMREAELDELRKEVDALRNTATGYLNVPDVPSIAKNEIRNSIQGTSDTAATTPDDATSAVAAGALEAPGAGTEAPAALPEAIPAPVDAAGSPAPDSVPAPPPDIDAAESTPRIGGDESITPEPSKTHAP